MSVRCRLFFNGKRMDMMRSEWRVEDFSCLEAMEFLTIHSTPERRLSEDGCPDQKRLRQRLLLEVEHLNIAFSQTS